MLKKTELKLINFGLISIVKGYATKMCTANGSWFRRGGFEKTNYSPCSPVVQLQLRTVVHISAYAISTAALLPALIIFYSYKQVNLDHDHNQ